MLFSLCRCQLRHIHHASINILISIIGWWWWHGIWRIRRIQTGYWISLQIMCGVRLRSGWLLTNRGQLSWFKEWIIPWGKLRYHWWRKLIALGVLTNRRHLRWIDDWIIQWKINRYRCLWRLDALWVTVVAIRHPVIVRSCSPSTLIVPGSTFVPPPKILLGTWHDE